MKGKKAGRVIILIAYFVMICLSKVIWLFCQDHFDSENYENRELAARPVLTLDHYGTFASDYTAFFNDHLQFRNILISLNSTIDYFCFGRSSSDYVIVGADHWLFYSREGDGDPVGCYQGTNLLSEEELEELAENCCMQRDYLLSKGKEFVIFIAPNKERMYPEYMPKRYGKPAEQYRALQIYEYLKEKTDLRVVYPYTELTDARSKLEERIYYKTDTHWNCIGAYVGASALLAELGIKMPKVTSESIRIQRGESKAGDLAGMLNLNSQLKSVDNEYILTGYEEHDREEIEWDIPEMIRYHATGADRRSIYVIRDSFSTNMAAYIGSQFTDSYLRHRDTYTYADYKQYDPDIVVYETVERYADRLASFSIR